MYRHREIITFTETYVVQKYWSIIVHVQIILLKHSSMSFRISTKKICFCSGFGFSLMGFLLKCQLYLTEIINTS